MNLPFPSERNIDATIKRIEFILLNEGYVSHFINISFLE